MYGCKRTTFARSYPAARSSQAVHTDFKGRAGTRDVLTQMLASVTIPAAMEAHMDSGAGNHSSHVATNRYRWRGHRTGWPQFGYACPRDGKGTKQTPGYKEGVSSTSSLKSALQKSWGVQKNILKTKPKQHNYCFLHACNSLVSHYFFITWMTSLSEIIAWGPRLKPALQSY